MLVRPPAILGAGETSVWNTLRPAEIREDESARHALPQQTFPWVHVDDLAALVADVATGAVPTSSDPEQGPVDGGCTAVNVAGGPATAAGLLRDGHRRARHRAGLGRRPRRGPSSFLVDRANRWGWTAEVPLSDALAEIDEGLRGR